MVADPVKVEAMIEMPQPQDKAETFAWNDELPWKVCSTTV